MSVITKKERISLLLFVIFVGILAFLSQFNFLFFLILLALFFTVLGYMFYLMKFPEKEPKFAEGKTQPFISILVSAHNEEITIKDLIRDIYSQSYSNFELIVIDDHSTDRTFEILKNLKEEYPRLCVIKREKGIRGKAASLNESLKAAKGEWILILDADARIKNDFLEKTVKFLSIEDAVAMQTTKMISNPDFNWLTKQQFNEYLIDHTIQRGKDKIGGCVELKGNGSFIKKDFLLSVGGWDENSLTEDLDFSTRTLIEGKSIKFIPDAIVYEQGVTKFKELFFQRLRWLEGSMQRYLKYYQDLIKLSSRKKLDLCIFSTEFIAPLWVLFDILFQFIRIIEGKSVKPWNLIVIFGILTIIMVSGFIFVTRSLNKKDSILKDSISISLYLLHWFPIVILATFHILFGKHLLRWRKIERAKMSDSFGFS